MPKRLIVFPALVAVFPILFLYAQNNDHFPIHVVWLPLAATLGAAVAIWAVAGLVLRSAHRGALLAALLLLLFFSYGQMVDVLRRANAGVFGLGPKDLSVILFAALCIAVTFFVLKTPKKVGRLLAVENFAALCLMAAPLAIIVNVQSHRVTFLRPEAKRPTSLRRAAGESPDIYYIILDGYGRDDVLRDLYGYDNSEFTDYLKSKGFRVARQSRSNYNQTGISLASSLNMTYLDRYTVGAEHNSDDRTPLSGMIGDNAVWSFLRSQGYQFTIFATSYDLLDLRSADNYRGPEALSEFEGGVADMTPLAVEGLPYAAHRSKIRYAFEHMGDAAADPRPNFTFAHIAAPHPPFIFGANGSDVTPDEGYSMGDGSHLVSANGITWRQYRDGYTNQLAYINKCVMKCVDNVLARSKQPPIIVIQGDHGPGSLLDQEDPGHTYLTERFSILNAYYLPNSEAGDIYDTISPVNSFRVILNRYFGAGYELLPDRSYFAAWSQPYKYAAVTEAIARESRAKAAKLISEKGGPGPALPVRRTAMASGQHQPHRL